MLSIVIKYQNKDFPEQNLFIMNVAYMTNIPQLLGKVNILRVYLLRWRAIVCFS